MFDYNNLYTNIKLLESEKIIAVPQIPWPNKSIFAIFNSQRKLSKNIQVRKGEREYLCSGTFQVIDLLGECIENVVLRFALGYSSDV